MSGDKIVDQPAAVSVGSSKGSAYDFSQLADLRRRGFITCPGNPHCAFLPGTNPLLCVPVEESTGLALLPNTKISHAQPQA